jgi:hypothetical protein
MPTEPFKYALNSFDIQTQDSNSLMSEILITTLPKLTAAAAAHAALAPSLTAVTAASTAWNAGETTLASAEATQLAATMLVTDKLASLTRKPDTETNSFIETWDSTIRSQVPYQGSVYTILLPNGRETLTAGGIDEQIDAMRDFGVRLAAQSAKPVLVTLGGTVTAFATAARTLRTSQLAAKAAVDAARGVQETLRFNAAAELYAMVGAGMGVFKATPALVDSLYDVSLLRGPSQAIPAAPADTTWTPATRTLSTTALPADATRLELWIEGPGGLTQLVAIGALGALSVVVPGSITFTAGATYTLWLQARNSAGSSGPGPKQTWVAV